MIQRWAAGIVGEMHLNHITAKEFSAKLGYRPEYVSKVLNGHCSPKSAEKKYRAALEELIAEKQPTQTRA